jgi:hypothetical protein
MEKEKYGEHYQSHLLEQYKLYVEMADRISARRGQINSFYISLLSGLLAVLSLSSDKQAIAYKVLILVVSLVGLILCFVWLFNIRSFKQLNSAKFTVVHEIEEFLPFACYDREWEIIKQARNDKYLQQTKIEQFIPLILALPYLGLLFYALGNIAK